MPDEKKEPKARPAPAPAPAPAAPPPLDERKLKLSELLPFGKQLDADELTRMARDGRGIVRANAALGLAAAGQPVFELVTLIRDSEGHVAVAAAEAVATLGPAIRPLIPQLVAALDGAQPDVCEAVLDTLSALIGACDPELVAALDVPADLAHKTITTAAAKRGPRGIAFLVQATAHDRSRIRVNAIAGLGRHGKLDPAAAMACLTALEAGDPVPDVRSAAKQAMLAVVAREKTVALDSLPAIADFEARKLSKGELMEHEGAIDIDQMIHALVDGRAHVKINAARALGIKGDQAARAAQPLGLLLRDSVPAVRREVALALGRIGSGAVAAAGALVGALGDAESDVVEAATATLDGLGSAARDALLQGLDAGDQAHGLRVGELVGKLPDAVKLLVDAFSSPAVNVQVNAALALGLLRGKVGAGLAVLHGARTGGDARTREAVRRALEMIEPKGDGGPKTIAVEGFEERFLAAADLEKAKAALEHLGAELIAHLADGRDHVRANAALALGAVGATGVAGVLGVRLRDDSARVRLAAAQALDKLGDAAVVEAGGDLVGALRDPDDTNAVAIAAILKARKAKLTGALIRGLEADDERHAKRIVEVINALPDAAELLTDAFESPAVNVQVNAALGLGMLGGRVGKGRRALEGARTGGWERTREAVRKALEMLDGPRETGPAAIEIEGFETRYLTPDAFKGPDGAAAKLPLAAVAAYLTDGRGIVRANAAMAVGAAGAPAVGLASSLAVLLRDDDSKVRIAAAGALDKLGDDAVKETAAFLVGALRGDAEVARACAPVLAARKSRVLTALLKGLETDDETHAKRILELINALADAPEILVDAIESPAENVQVNAAIGLGMLGAKRAGTSGRRALETRRTGGFARTREAVFKGLALLDAG